MRRIFATPLGSVVFGLICFLLAFMGYSPTVDCHRKPMLRSETCAVTDNNGVTRNLTYDQQKTSGEIFTYVMVGLGGIMFVTGAVRMVKRRRRLNAAREDALHLVPPTAQR